MIITTSAPRLSRLLLVTVYNFHPLKLHGKSNYRTCCPVLCKAGFEC